MSTFLEAFELPITRKYNGKAYTLPLLTTRDYGPWLRELTEQRKKEFTELLPQQLPPVDRYNVQRSLALMACTPDDLVPLLPVPENTERVLRLSAEKAKVPAEEIDGLIDSKGARQNLMDAWRISALVSADRFYETYEDQKPAEPNPDNTADPNGTFGPNGSSPGATGA